MYIVTGRSRQRRASTGRPTGRFRRSPRSREVSSVRAWTWTRREFFHPPRDHVIKVTPRRNVIHLFSSAPLGIKRALNLALDRRNNIYIADDSRTKS